MLILWKYLKPHRRLAAWFNILFASLVGVGFLVWYSITRHWALVPVFLVGVLLLGGLTGLLSREIKTQQRSIVRETAEIGFVTQETHLFAGTLRENMHWTRSPKSR